MQDAIQFQCTTNLKQIQGLRKETLKKRVIKEKLKH